MRPATRSLPCHSYEIDSREVAKVKCRGDGCVDKETLAGVVSANRSGDLFLSYSLRRALVLLDLIAEFVSVPVPFTSLGVGLLRRLWQNSLHRRPTMPASGMNEGIG